MLLESAAIASREADLTNQVRGRIAAGADIREVDFLDMPLWLFREVDQTRPVQAVFLSSHAGLVVYADGARTLRQVPSYV